MTYSKSKILLLALLLQCLVFSENYAAEAELHQTHLQNDSSSSVNSVTGIKAQQTTAGKIDFNTPTAKKSKGKMSLEKYSKTLLMTNCQSKEFDKFKKEHPEASVIETENATKLISKVCEKRLRHAVTENKKLSPSKMKRLASPNSGKANKSLPMNHAIHDAESPE